MSEAVAVPYVPGGRTYRSGSPSVTEFGQKDVTRGYRWRIPRADTGPRSPSVGIDRSTVLLLLGFCLVADGGALLFVGWLLGGAS